MGGQNVTHGRKRSYVLGIKFSRAWKIHPSHKRQRMMQCTKGFSLCCQAEPTWAWRAWAKRRGERAERRRDVGRGEVTAREQTPCPDSPTELHHEETGCRLRWLDMSKGRGRGGDPCKFYSRVVSGKKTGLRL